MAPPSKPISSSSDTESYELSQRSLPSSSSVPVADDDSDFELDGLEATHGLLGTPRRKRPASSSLPRICASCGSQLRLFCRRTAGVRHRCAQLGIVLFVAMACLLVFTFIFNPSYTKDQYPENYSVVADAVRKGGGRNPAGYWRRRVMRGKKGTAGGRGNPNGEKVFIAANIVDAGLVAGAWGDAVMELMDLIGEENVFLSECSLCFTDELLSTIDIY